MPEKMTFRCFYVTRLSRIPSSTILQRAAWMMPTSSLISLEYVTHMERMPLVSARFSADVEGDFCNEWGWEEGCAHHIVNECYEVKLAQYFEDEAALLMYDYEMGFLF